MRNRNVFIRKDTAHYCERNPFPVFAHVTGYHDSKVYYQVDYPEPVRAGHRWHYASRDARSGTYIKPLEEFLSRFAPDYDNSYGAFV